MKMKCLRFALFPLGFLALTVDAAHWRDHSATAADRTVEGAGAWFDAANWVDGDIPSGPGAEAEFYAAGSDTQTGVRYTSLDRPVTARRVRRWWAHSQTQATFDANRRHLLSGGNVLTLDHGGSGDAILAGLAVHGPVVFSASASYPCVTSVDFCGPVVNETGKALQCETMRGTAVTRFRRDLWADGPGCGITNFAPSVYRFDGSVSLAFVAPEGSDGVSSAWTLTQGARWAVFAGAQRPAVSVGTSVSGEGVRAGTYIRRIGPDGRIELSEPADLSGTSVLSFAAFRPKAYQRIDPYQLVSHAETYRTGFYPMKHAQDDEMTVELFDLNANGGKASYHLLADCEAGFLPGRLVLHNTSAFKYDFYLGTCEVEFAAPTNATPAGFPKTVRMAAADDTAVVRVPAGVDAVFGALTQVIGTFIKKGAGSLTVAAAGGDAFAPGDASVLAVEEGVFSLAASGDEPVAVQTLRLSAGAVLVLPPQGLFCASFSAEPGAVVRGNAVLHVEKGAADGVVFEEGAYFSAASGLKTGDWFFDAPAAAVPGHPAVWLDVSRPETLLTRPTAAKYGSTNALLRWTDVRGAEFGWATNSARKAPLLVADSRGAVNHVNFPYSGTEVDGERYALHFHKPLTGVRHIFKVLTPVNGTPQPIGGSALYAPYERKAYDNKPALAWTSGNGWLSNTLFRVNGVEGDWRKGYPYRGAATGSGSEDVDFLMSVPAERAVKVTVEFAVPEPGVSATNLGDSNIKSCAGRERLYECLIYTNRLTASESAQITRYLMEKWMAAEVNWTPADARETAVLSTGSEPRVYLTADEARAIGSLEGTPALRKRGPGTLMIADAGAGTPLSVEEGVVVLRSFTPRLEAVRGRPYLHVDASCATSFTSMNGGTVLAWRDARGEGYPVCTALGKGPSLVENALNGLPAVDFGVTTLAKDSASGSATGLAYPAVSNAHAVVGVWQTAGGGGPLLGWSGKGVDKIAAGHFPLGIYRSAFADRTERLDPKQPLTALTSVYNPHNGHSLSLGLRAGGTRTRMNGEEIASEVSGFTGDWDLFSYVSYDDIGAGALAQSRYSASYTVYGGAKMAETFVFTNVPSRDSVCRLEAYLRQKWFNRSTPRYRPAVLSGLDVSEGAVLVVSGGTPVSVGTLRVDGAVAGSVRMADGGAVSATVASDGVLRPLNVTGGLSLSGEGRIVLTGAARSVADGDYPFCRLNGDLPAGWCVEAPDPRRRIRLVVRDGVLVLQVFSTATCLTIR